MGSSGWVDALGPLSESAINRYLGSAGLFPEADERPAVEALVARLRASGWSDGATAELFAALEAAAAEGLAETARRAAELVPLHGGNDHEGVIACICFDPPAHYEVRRLLSRAGRHKLVFEAHSTPRVERVVLKRFVDPASAPEALERDLVTRPSHPHLIATDVVTNASGEAFLVEAPLDEVIDDTTTITGQEELANMVHELAMGLTELHEVARLAHNDIKPGNFGIVDGKYVLIDLGNCSDVSAASALARPGRGSLRTRAPEALLGVVADGGQSADVWALGAVLHYYLFRRYPLLTEAESDPAAWSAAVAEEPAGRSLRTELEAVLPARAEEEYERRISIPDRGPMAELLAEMLQRDWARRPSAREVANRARQLLGSHLRHSEVAGTPPPRIEARVILDNLPGENDGASRAATRRLIRRLRELRGLTGWDDRETAELDEAISRLDPGHDVDGGSHR